MKKTVLLKISGEALLGQKDYGIDNNVVDRIALEMKEAGGDTQIAVVVGGGNIFRGMQLSNKTGMVRATADSMGMLATIMNAIALKDRFMAAGTPTQILSSFNIEGMIEGFESDKAIRILERGNVDFILYDLGVSMFHFKKAERGFSFNENNKLDMRLGINKINAYEVINKYEKKDLERIFKEYGEIKNYSKLAEIIIKERNKKNIETAKELENIIFHNSDKSKKYGKINPATLIFQAIRIEVNDELNILKKSIENIKNILKKYGVVVIISYHSLEDRIVKRFFKDNEKTKNKDGIFKLLNSKVLKPTNEEIKLNIASRSAKLRAAQLL